MKRKNRILTLGYLILLFNIFIIPLNATESDTESISIEYTPLPNAVTLGSDDFSQMLDSPDTSKIEDNIGETIITIPNSSSEVKYYHINDDLTLTETTSEEYDVSFQSSLITDIDEGYIYTIGGADVILDSYYTLEDAINDENSVPINGGANVGTYVETIEQNGNDYVHYEMDGADFYIQSSNVQILPEEYAKSTEYYELEEGYLVKNIPYNVLEDNSYEAYPVISNPTWAMEDVKYYSEDGENFYTDQKLETYAGSGSEYFQNLPIRSTSSYNSTEYQNYLTARGKTSSEYYNSTNAFVEAQEINKINSLLLFSMANLESAYGTSNYAVQCNNFFGRAAYDSDPDQACIQASYDTPRDGIIAQSYFLYTEFLDITDWRYSGYHVGDKSSGLNVRYASDPDWGAKIGAIALDVDRNIGGSENGQYTIATLSSSTGIFENSNLTNKISSQAYNENGNATPTNYDLQSNSENSDRYVNVLVVDESSSAYEVQLPTPLNNSGGVACNITFSKYGSYPDFGNINYPTQYVHKGSGSFACEYDHWATQTAWIKKSKVDSFYNNPGEYVSPEDVIPDNIPTTCGAITEVDGDNWTFEGDYVTCEATMYNSEVPTSLDIYTYDNDNELTSHETIIRGIKGVIQSEYKTNYYSGGNKLATYSTTYEDGIINSFEIHEYNYNGTEKLYQVTSYGMKGLKHKRTTVTYNEGVKAYKYNYTYNSSGVTEYMAAYRYNDEENLEATTINYRTSQGVNISKVNTSYDNNGKITDKVYFSYDNGDLKATTDLDYYDDTNKVYLKVNTQYSIGNVTGVQAYRYDENNTLEAKTQKFYSNNKMYKKINTTYYSDGSYTVKTYNY